ncbi:hypothetical protein N7524_011714, partial [Penicillium chrysogenum]
AYTVGPSSLPPSSQPDLSYVANIFDSTLDLNIDPKSEFTQPALLDCSLKRVGPDRRKQFILYDTMNNASKAKFIEWWRITENFDQVAHHITGEPLVICRTCRATLPHPRAKQSGTNTLKRHIASGKCQKGSKSKSTQQEQIECLTSLNLPFRILKRKQFTSLIRMAQKAPAKPTLLHPRTAQRRLKKLIRSSQSPLTTRHRLSSKHLWRSQDTLSTETRITMSSYLGSNHLIERILAVQDSIDSLKLPNNLVVVRIPYLAHIIQLSLRELLRSVKIDPQNDTTDRNPKPKLDRSVRPRVNKSLYKRLLRFAGLLYLLMQAPNVVMISSVSRLIEQNLRLSKMSAHARIQPS